MQVENESRVLLVRTKYVATEIIITNKKKLAMNNMTFSEIVVSKLLFFVQNNFECKSFSVLQGILVNFYSEESICINC